MSQAAARIAAIQQRDRAATAPEPPPAAAQPGRRRTVRQTVDLGLDAYAGLSSWCVAAAPAAGRTRSIAKQEVLATLVAMLLEDESFARRVRARLAEAGDQ